MKKLVSVAIATVALMAAGSASAIDIAIDDFNIAQIVTQNGVGTNTSTVAGSGGVVWDNRILGVQVVSGGSDGEAEVFPMANPPNGVFAYSANFGVDANYTLEYTGLFDLTGGQTGGVLGFESLGLDTGGAAVTYTITDSVSATATQGILIPAAAGRADVALSGFVGVDLTNIVSFQILIDPAAPAAADGAFTLVGTFDFDAAPVPAPAGIALFALGLLGMRRLRK